MSTISVPLVIKPTVYRCTHSCADLLPAKCGPTTATFPTTTPIGPGHTSMKIVKIISIIIIIIIIM